MSLIPHALPAVCALVANAVIFFYARYSNIHNLQTRLYLLFLFSLSIQTLAEISIFAQLASGAASETGGRIWFSSTIFALALFLHLALVMSTDRADARISLRAAPVALLHGPSLILQALLWFTPLLVAGFEPMSYTITKIPGPAYFLFELYALTYLGAAALLLVRGAYYRASGFQRRQNKLLLFGLVPFVALAISVIVLQRLGFRGFNATMAQPMAITFFLAITAYATHQYRLFDVEFFLPWSRVRKRKTEFYRRIQATIGAIAELRSVREIAQLIAETLRCQVALVGGPQPVTAFARQQDMQKDVFLLAQFPLEQLQKVEQIVVAHEIADSDRELHRIMDTYRAGAIVPFKAHDGVASHWLILGDHFSNEVYTPLDFKMVESLFAVMAERFLDDFLHIRSHLGKMQEQLAHTKLQLGLAWHKEHEAKMNLDAIRAENRELQQHIVQLQRNDPGQNTKPGRPPLAATRALTLEGYMRVSEKRAVVSALRRAGGNKRNAAESLGVTVPMLEHLLARHAIDPDLVSRR